MMLSVGVVAMAAEILSNRDFTIKQTESHTHGPTFNALSKIEMPSILFFLGILMTVAALESLGLIFTFGQDVNAVLDQDVFITLLELDQQL